MDKEQIGIPKLRFPGFTDAWKQRRFEDISKLSQGLQIAISKRFTHPGDGKLFYITNEFLNPNSTVKYYIDSPAKNVIAGKTDILMTRTGNTGKVVTDVEGVYHNNFFKISYNSSKTDRWFLYYLLNSYPIQREILVRAGNSTIPDLNHNDFYRIKIYIPTIEEQIKIGTFLTKVDSLIALHQRKLEHLKQQKNGLLQKMFPKNGESVPEVRFPGFTAPWERRRLGEVADSVKYGINAPAKEYDGINKYLRITDIDDTTHEFLQSDLTSPDTDLTLAEKFKLLEGDILFARTGASVGKSYIYSREDGSVYYAGFLIRMRFNQSIFPNFIFQNTLTAAYKQYVEVTSQRSGQPGVNAKEYSNYSLYIPSKEEQQKIGSFFQQLDTLIALHQRRIEHLELLKKGLLQQMFV